MSGTIISGACLSVSIRRKAKKLFFFGFVEWTSHDGIANVFFHIIWSKNRPRSVYASPIDSAPCVQMMQNAFLVRSLYSKINFWLLLYFEIDWSEPVTSVAPKLTSGDDYKRLKVATNQSIAFLCPAQSFPVPAFR